MDFFDELLNEKPEGLHPHRNTGKIKAFVRSHFGRLLAVKAKGYSWEQIARIVRGKTDIPSENLPKSLRTAFCKIKKERIAKSFLKSLSEENNYVS